MLCSAFELETFCPARHTSRVKFFIHLFITLLALAASTVALADPLFEDDQLLKLSITADFETIVNQRDKTQKYPAEITMEGETTIPLEIQVRGNRRLQADTCSFPPLRLRFKKENVKNTVFESQKKLKLVTQCKTTASTYEQYLVTEYLIYKMLNVLTQDSYQVRIAEITYKETSGEKRHKNYAFFLESNRQLSERIDLERHRAQRIDPADLDATHQVLVNLFEYMIGNTDWSAVTSNDDECCHNGKLFGDPTEDGLVFIPYDFDITGLVDPEYGAPPPQLKLENLKQRRYRGYCIHNEAIRPAISRIYRQKDELLAVLKESPYLSNGKRAKAVAYLNRFFKTLESPRSIDRQLLNQCLPIESEADSI